MLGKKNKMFYNNCFLKYKQSIRNTWATIREIMGKNQNQKNTPTPSHTKTNQWQINKTLRTVLMIFFISLGATISSKIKKKTNVKSFTDHSCDKNEHVFNYKTVSEANVSKIISEMKFKNSSGHDEISSKKLKIISNSLAEPLILLINQCL